jgi:hypothetical protein
MTMEKISSRKVAAVLSTVPTMLRSLARERDDLLEKVAALKSKVSEYQRRERVERLAKVAEEKGIDSWGESREEKVASIEGALEKGRSIDVMEEAVKLSSPRGDLAALTGDELTGEGGGSEGSKATLEGYLLGQLG